MLLEFLHAALNSSHSPEVPFQKRSRPRKLKIILWPLSLLKLGKSLSIKQNT